MIFGTRALGVWVSLGQAAPLSVWRPQTKSARFVRHRSIAVCRAELWALGVQEGAAGKQAGRVRGLSCPSRLPRGSGRVGVLGPPRERRSGQAFLSAGWSLRHSSNAGVFQVSGTWLF